MDPNACFSELLEALACDDYDDALVAATNLREWFEKDGFTPGADLINRNSILVFCEWVMDEHKKLVQLSQM